MELVTLLATWWWIAPAAVGAGSVSYVALTTGRRRARRLALDAAVYEEQAAARSVLAAKAAVRQAQAQVLAAKSRSGGWASEERRALGAARQAQKSAGLALKASRERVRAERIQLTAGSEVLPLAQVVARHDAVMLRWIEYETDVELAIAFPQMSDPKHPSTLAFLRAQQEAQHLRPADGSARMLPADFVRYRAAVLQVEVTFEAAESDAMRTSARRVTGAPRRTPVPPAPEARPAAEAAPSPAPAAASGPNSGESVASAPESATQSGSSGVASPAPEQPAPGIWPVPRRSRG